MTRATRLLIGIAAALAGAFVARRAMDWLRREPAVPKTVVERPWVEQSFDTGGYAFDAPWRLEPSTVNFPPEVAKTIATSAVLGHEADGLYVMAMHLTFLPGAAAGSLEGAADGSLANMRSVPGTASVKGAKHEASVLGMPAFDIEARIERERGAPLQLYGLVFGQGVHLYQMQFIAAADQPSATETWKRMRKSLRNPGAS